MSARLRLIRMILAAMLATAMTTDVSPRHDGSATITIVPVASVTVSPASASIAVGATRQLSAVPKDSAGSTLAGRVVTWLATNRSGTSGASSLVTGVAPGVATITATSEGMSGTAVVFVSRPPEADFKSPILACVILPCKEMVKEGYAKLRERPRSVVRGFRLPFSVPLAVLPFIVAAAILLSIGVRIGSAHPSRFSA
jgi:hypothetical protein